MIKWLAGAALGLATAAPADAATGSTITLTRLDCGMIAIKGFNAFFSDRLEYGLGPRRLAVSCFPIKRFDTPV